MGLLIQQGYGKGSKIHDSIENKVADGVVLSPRDDKEENIQILVNEVYDIDPQSKLILDPQFYYATYIDGTYKKLEQVPYFPGHLKMSDLRGMRKISEYVHSTLEYQINMGLNEIVAPTILIPNFSDRQAQTALNFAEEAIHFNQDKDRDLYISLVFKESALNETDNVNEFLNELTLLDVKGYYITVARNNSNYDQKFDDPLSLNNLLSMIYSLAEINEYEVIMGYSDIIGLLYLTVGAKYIATGWHNSSKKFTEKQRIQPVTGGRQPRERYTSLPLLNSILLTELDSIYEQFYEGEFNEFLSGAMYDELVNTGTPSTGMTRNFGHFQHWSSLKKLSDQLLTYDIEDRIDLMFTKIDHAKGLYRELDKNAVQLSPESSETHLSVWENALRTFKERHYL